jgi:TolB-like protein/DNA-binding winged helix-turn-helix (wHTH) protein
MKAALVGCYRFGDLTFDVGRRRVSRGVDAVPLTKLSFELLRALVEAAPNVVTPDQLVERVWGPRRIVTPENLSQRVMMLRQALGDSAEQPRYVEGLRGHGYRLVPNVEPWDGDVPTGGPATVARVRTDPRAWLRVPALRRTLTYVALAATTFAIGLLVRQEKLPRTQPNSVAVIPLSNLGTGEADDSFAFGMHQEIINQLAKVSDLTVISRTTMMRYADGSRTPKQIAEELNVETVLEGSIRRSGDSVRVAVQLVDPTTDSMLWSETFTDKTDVANMLAIQANIATSVAAALEARLSSREQSRLERVPTASSEAYGHYLAAIAADQSSSPEASANAMVELTRAVEIDPQFALAWATLSYTLSVAPTWRPDGAAEYQDAALQTALRALEIQPDLAEAHKALSFASTVRGEWRRSEQEYARAIELGATRAEMAERGNFELAVGHVDAARATFQRNQLVNPLNSTGLAFFLAASEIAGDRSAVREGYEQGRVFMGAWPFGEYLMNYIRLGRRDGAALVPDSVIAPRFKAEFREYESAPAALAALRAWYGSLESPNHNDHTLVAAWAAYYGDAELALAAAQSATRTRKHNVWFLWLPLFEEVRRTPGFRKLVAELGLVDYWGEYGWPAACRGVSNVAFQCE